MSEKPYLDHRELNTDMAVFATAPTIGAGLPLWLPAGAAIRRELERLAEDIAIADGCLPVYSPVLAKRALFEKSGHWAKFADDMFPPMQVGGDELVLRPANCPHHAAIYAAEAHSYRELPIRLHELAPMFRAERTGVLSGLSRVRQIDLDDTHVFCREDQVQAEASRALRSALQAQETLGMRVDAIRLSRRDTSDSYLGDADLWQSSEEALRQVAAQLAPQFGLPIVEALGEAAFYGPKLDLQVHDGRGHEETIATVQLDFNQPERFGLTYTAPDNSRRRPVMIHRGTVGSMERVTAALLERYQGRLPLWLAPTQVAVLPVTDQQTKAARDFADGAARAGLRVRMAADGALGARIRESRQRRDAVVAVIGPKEAADRAVQLNDFASERRAIRSVSEALELLADAARQRLARLPL